MKILGEIESLGDSLLNNKLVCPFERAPDYSRNLEFLRPVDGYLDLGEKRGGYPNKKAVLYRPDRLPLELPVLGDEINFVSYVYFLNKYLLNDRDYRRHPGKVWSPFRLMTPEGEISEIKFSEDFVAQVLNNQTFELVVPLRSGLLVAATGVGRRNAGFFLLMDSKVVRIWGGGHDFANNYSASPDGCRLSFLSYKNHWYGPSAQTVKIINVCRDEK